MGTFHELPEKRSEIKYFSVRKSKFSFVSSSPVSTESGFFSSIGFPFLSKSQNPRMDFQSLESLLGDVVYY